MALNAGSKLGPYEIISAIGAGGMGEVYRAKDSRLNRIVAIKVLPAHLSANPQLKQRFEREARAISSLSHPNICALYDIGHQNGEDFLVMEFLEGQTLANRIDRGALPADQVLRYGIQIAEALDKAHRQGIVHRDLKPGNIMITKSGAKLLDFGLAKYQEKESNVPLASVLETRDRPLTDEGTILGTVQYMAPEQLEGKEADTRTDIFALGQVLYEMATGERTFKGDSKGQIMAAILSSEPPPISSVQPLAPPALDHVIKKCLQKDPDERWQSAHDVGSELKWISEQTSPTFAPALKARRKISPRIPWVLAALFLMTALASILVLYRLKGSIKEHRLLKFSILPEQGTTLNLTGAIAISPDGKHLAFSGVSQNGQTTLFVRSLDSMQSKRLPGTDDAAFPFWSADSAFIGFFAQGKLKKIDILGGPPQTLCESSAGRGGTWNKDGVILFSPGLGEGLYRISGAGGTVSPVTTLEAEREEATHRFPNFLPDGDHFFYLSRSVKPENTGIFLGSLSSPKSAKRILADESVCYYSDPGYILFMREGNVVAQQFDLSNFQTKGEGVPVAEGVYFEPSSGNGFLTNSSDGILVYATSSGNQYQQFAWFDRQGKQLDTLGEPGILGDPWFSPDETKLAHYSFRTAASGKPDIWITDLKQRTSTRFTFNPANEFTPVWSPDGSRIAFSSNRTGSYSLCEKSLSGSGEEKILLQSSDWKFADDWTKDGKYIIFENDGPKTKADIWVLPLFGDGKPFAILHSEFNEAQANVSPDGKWIAYGSDETGRAEIYVQSFPTPGAKRQISTSGGTQPRWAKNQKELFYMAPDGKLMVTEIKSDGSLEVIGVPQALFSTHVPLLPLVGNDRNQFVVTSDNQRFIINRLATEGLSTPITVILNWTQLLKK